MLNKAFSNDAPKRTTVFEWHSRFKAGRISIEDDPRQGRPKFQRTDENVKKITDLIKENPRTTLLELEQDTGISKTTIGRIVTEDLKLKKTPAKFIPRFLTNEQKLCRLATCEDMMEMIRTDPEWKDKIITGDETWVYGYDPETKPQSAEWRDIAPNDFFLFPKLKAVLKGRHFDTRDDIIEKSPLALKSIPKEAYKNCFDNWEKRWRCYLRLPSSRSCCVTMAAVSAITAAVEKLNGQNYRSWKYNIKMLLIEKGLWDVMFKDEDTQDAQLKAQKDRALAVIALSMNTEHQIHIIDCSSPQDAWKNLEQVFEPKSRSRILQLKKQFVNIKLQTGESMLDYLNRLKICTDHLKEAGAEVDDQDIAYSMLSRLPDSFDTLVMSFGNVEDSDFTSNKVRNTLLTEYERRSAREGASSGLGEALNFPKDDTRKTSRKQGVKCYRCSKIGHIAKDCRSSINRDYKADKSYSRKKDSFKSPSENMLMAFNAVSSEDEFILDSGATHHVCKNRQWFTSFQPTTCEPIQTASGNLQVEGVGNIRMKMYRDTGTQDVTLNDVLFVPQARRNLLSVSQTEDKGKHIKICNHKARVFNDNRVICVARNLNGLYIVRGKKHWEAAKHVLRYLSGTIDLELSYVKGNNNKVAMFTDADYGSDTDDRRSYSGMVAVIDGNVINWRSKKQQCVSLSTVESEYIALCHSAKEAVWLGQTLSDLGFISHFAKPLTIYCDNRSVIDFSKNNIENNRSKHISVQFHYTRDKINSGDIVVQFVNTKENMADIQTKTLKKLMHRDSCFQMNFKSQVYEYQGNLYYKEDLRAQPVAVTSNGAVGSIFAGVPDWLYEGFYVRSLCDPIIGFYVRSLCDPIIGFYVRSLCDPIIGFYVRSLCDPIIGFYVGSLCDPIIGFYVRSLCDPIIGFYVRSLCDPIIGFYVRSLCDPIIGFYVRSLCDPIIGFYVRSLCDPIIGFYVGSLCDPIIGFYVRSLCDPIIGFYVRSLCDPIIGFYVRSLCDPIIGFYVRSLCDPIIGFYVRSLCDPIIGFYVGSLCDPIIGFYVRSLCDPIIGFYVRSLCDPIIGFYVRSLCDPIIGFYVRILWSLCDPIIGFYVRSLCDPIIGFYVRSLCDSIIGFYVKSLCDPIIGFYVRSLCDPIIGFYESMSLCDPIIGFYDSMILCKRSLYDPIIGFYVRSLCDPIIGFYDSM
ncbi:hypothetical protein LAZ67_23001719 [Cordylochernes scorpioides]|uniref:CCHC-type domain-containing protein n=1 Tax=Cordylochernes scorpioides TaxID=51811 RepID=A0ABY6LQW2_9ARAC|nr:hypothetical protein LAZ67_23001719 [Cordylochernes scorpioides]